MYTMIGYQVSHDPNGAYTPLTPIPDQHVRADGNGIIIPQKYNKVFGAAAFLGANAAQCRMIAPSLRNMGLEMISPIYAALIAFGEHMHNIVGSKYIDLEAGEELEIHENSNPGAAELHTALVLLTDSEIVPVKGKIRSLGFTVTGALVAGAWTNSPVVFDENLPIGNYDIVGLRAEIANGIAARIVTPGAANRPGVLTAASVGVEARRLFRDGNLGVIATFDTTNIFSLDLLGGVATASTAYRGVIDIIKR